MCSSGIVQSLASTCYFSLPFAFFYGQRIHVESADGLEKLVRFELVGGIEVLVGYSIPAIFFSDASCR